jgi:hypothetical protein
VCAWLYGVALRLALKMRSQRFSRHTRERKTGVLRRASDNETAFRELQEALVRTLQTLPEKYRTVLLLCYLEGRKQEEVSKLLACPLGTVRSRLAQARRLLRNRLLRQGIGSSSGALTALTALGSASRAVPPALLRQTTTSAAHCTSAAHALAIPPSVVNLIAAGLRLTARKKASAWFLALATSACLAGLGIVAYPSFKQSNARPFEPTLFHSRLHQGQAADVPAKNPQSNPRDKDEMLTSGRVLDTKGRPVAKASVALVGRPRQPHKLALASRDYRVVLATGTSDPDGHFNLRSQRTSSARFF